MSSMTPMSPQHFIAKWGPGGPAAHLNEEQGAQSHFLDLCELLGVPKPGSLPAADEYVFEQRSLLPGQARGFADVFYRDHFAWENKAPGKDLDAALRQLQQYSLALSNPPLLVVCDRLAIRIHTQFNGHPSETHTVLLPELSQPDKRALLRRLWLEPEHFRPQVTNRAITEAAAKSFATLADGVRRRGGDANDVAHFLTQCLFCFFAEDVGLLPVRMFEGLVNNRALTSDKLTRGLHNLFTVMQGGGLYGNDDIPWFNGGLFARIAVPKLEIIDITELRNAAALDWSAIDVSIFGTLFERGLDPAKRSQLGAHYTDPATIARIVEPVITRPLLQKWEQAEKELQGMAAKIRKHGDAAYKKTHNRFVQWLEELRAFRILDPACGSGNFLFLGLKALKDVEVHSINQAAGPLGLDREQDLVTGPHNLLGIELNDYAAELARVSVWIGEIQWRIAHGYPAKTNPVLEPLEQIECRDALLAWQQDAAQAVGPAPIAEPTQAVGSDHDAAQALGSDHDFAQRNSCSDPDAGPQSATPTEAPWPRADVVIGNPPFLGVSRKRRELGESYTRALDAIYAPGVPGGADLVCYWFAKALKAIATNGLSAAGLVATNSIRGGANRKVLQAITERSHIFAAWSDEPWVNDGAAVRVSLVCFGPGDGAELNGEPVPQIYADLTAPTATGDLLDVSRAHTLPDNLGASFQGASKKAKFEIDAQLARDWLGQPNPHGRPNSDVLKPWANGFELSRGPQHQWIIDFGLELTEAESALYEAPFSYAVTAVKPGRLKNNREAYRKYWWRFAEPRPGLRAALKPLTRFIATVAHSKHRLFVWLPVTTSPDQALITVARADDTTFGILHSRFHELWSLRMGTSLEDRPRYTPTTCFETFPFPAGLTPQDTAHQRTEMLEDGALIPANLPKQPANDKQNVPQAQAEQAKEAIKSISTHASTHDIASAIARAAHRLGALRQNWLNPPEWTVRVPEVVPLGLAASPYPDRIAPRPDLSAPDAKALQQRTLTNLYNQRPAWLAQAHAQLDAFVATAYGWADYSPAMPDDEILKRLLALNLERMSG